MAILGPQEIKRVVLMGFMGSGKSTIGKLLAQRLSWNFIDLDTAVEQHCGRTVPQIFAESGEHAFRNQESAALHRSIKLERTVIALGGGAPETVANQALLRNTPGTMVIYLEADFGKLQERCSLQAEEPGATERPLLSDLVAAQTRFDARRPIYENVATLRLDTTKGSPAWLADAILKHLV